MKKLSVLLGICLFFSAAQELAAFTEPSMSEYQALPIFTAQSVQPNIMIILDNSGSMNEPAYRDSFSGEPYFDGAYPVTAYDDDMEGSGAPDVAPDWALGDLDMGESTVGLRFQNIEIAQGAEITNAYIEFVACDSDSIATSLTIVGEASDNALPFSANNSITDRTATSSSSDWSSIPAWTNGTHYNSPDLTSIVQEIVDRNGWSRGSAMVFRITGNGERDAHSRNSSSTLMPRLHIETANHGKRYYGYFNPDFFYQYSSNIFTPVYQKISYDADTTSWTARAFDSATETFSGSTTNLNASDIEAGLWDGNFLNWVCMRRVDVLRKVMVGGLSNSRQGGGKQSVNGEDPTNSAYYANWQSYGFTKTIDTTSNMPVCPYHGSYTYYQNESGALVVVGKTTYDVEVQKEPVIEPEDFDSGGELAGVLQRIDKKARWGNTWFNSGGWGSNGGTVKIAIDGAAMANMISSLSNESCITNTPLAETMYTVMQYFKQEDLQSGLGYPNNCLPNPVQYGGVKDPYYHQTADIMVPCAKSFVILLTDGGSTSDGYVPDYLKDADSDGNDSGCSGDCSSNYLDDVAFYARTHDLRDDLDGDQNLILYTIFAFAQDNTARNLLMDAARNGGFEDRNGNNRPDGDYSDDAQDRLEWDKDGDAIPDTYFEASDGYALEARLLAAITDILKRAASGTAASVLSTNNQGAGNSIQAYFKPMVQEGLEEAMWLGYLQSLWVDAWGNLREDSNGDLMLEQVNGSASNIADSNVDKIIEYFSDGDETKIRRYTKHYLYNPSHGKSDTCGFPEDCTTEYDELPMDGISPIFESGQRLADRDPAGRTIFTYIDNDKNGTVDSGEVIDFNLANATQLTPYLGVRDGAKWGDSGLKLGSSLSARVNNIVTWVRGTDVTGLRNRTLANNTWRLGDIVDSTPMTVGLPQEYYHELYADLEYLDFIQYAKNRETMIYVGANDGMLHAFTSWLSKKDDAGNIWYEKPSAALADEKIGDEVWAYIPQSVLPHLKWTAHSNYTHTYYVDGPVRVFDAKILPDDTYYSDLDNHPNFGTFMVFGLNLGGKQISVNEDFGTGATEVRTFYPTYVMMDVTDPRNPALIWERTYPELGLTTVTPAPMHLGSRNGDDTDGKWYLVFGSGPTDYDGSTSLKGHVFVVDMATGDPVGAGGDDWIATASSASYFNEPLVLDVFQSHNADAVFIANNYVSGNKLQSDIWKIAPRCSKCEWDEDVDGNKLYDVLKDELEYDKSPADWEINKDFFHADGPITAQMAVTWDPLDNLLLYVGTGRYMSEEDKEDPSQQYLYCIKDPFYNKTKYEGDYYHNYDDLLALERSDLMASDDIFSLSNNVVGNVVTGYDGVMDFWDFVDAVREKEDGWYLSMQTPASGPSERIITQTAILGGVQLTPTFTPSSDICGMGGDTTFVGTYFETGTGYIRQLFEIETFQYENVSGEAAEIIEIRDDDLYKGMPAPKAVFHAGLETGARITTQVGTGEFVNFIVDPAFYFKSMATEWWDDPNQTPTFNNSCGW